MANRQFLDGFDFCLKLLVGDSPLPTDLVENLWQVANGKLSLQPTQTEFRLTVEKLEATMAEGLSERQRTRCSALKNEVVRQFSASRKKADLENIQNALMILRAYGAGIDKVQKQNA